MKLSLFLATGVLLFSQLLVAHGFDYPNAERGTQTDDYFGVTVADPYRWMENSSPELATWIDAENHLTQSYLATIPFRDALRKRLTDVVNYPKYTLPWSRDGRRFYFHNTGLQNQSVLYVIDDVDVVDAKPRILIDPNTFAADGTVSLSACVVSRDGRYLAYSIARSGSDWNEINVIDVATGKMLDDHVVWVKFSNIAWHGDGFYYSRYDAPPEGEHLTAKNENHQIFFHKLGTSQRDDILVREGRERPLRRRATTDRNEQFLFISESETTYGNNLAFRSLTKSTDAMQVVVSDFDSWQSVVAVLDGKIYLLTDRGASNRRLVVVDPKNPEPAAWRDVIPEGESLLESVDCIGGRFVATFLHDAAHVAAVYDTRGEKIRDVTLPTLGVVAFSGEPDSPEYFQSFTSFTYPTVIERGGSIDSDTREMLFPAAIAIDQDGFVIENAFVTERVWYTSRDGTRAPIFLTYKRGFPRDGNRPTLLYGYGGFNSSMKPSFSALRLPFLEDGGIYAVAVLRGGGEYGETWYQAGTKLRKQNVFDDFIAAAEHLIAERYTSPQRLAIQGGSNGGLLVAAVLTQRPDLFRAAVPAVGVLDMLRYHRFTIGWSWQRDYGTSEESVESFQNLLAYSPLHNIRAGVEYPAMLITTSDHDDRVVPAHSFKFTAAMQATSTSSRPAYIRVETKAGHGAGKPITKVIDEATDVWSFLMDQLGMRP